MWTDDNPPRTRAEAVVFVGFWGTAFGAVTRCSNLGCFFGVFLAGFFCNSFDKQYLLCNIFGSFWGRKHVGFRKLLGFDSAPSPEVWVALGPKEAREHSTTLTLDDASDVSVSWLCTWFSEALPPSHPSPNRWAISFFIGPQTKYSKPPENKLPLLFNSSKIWIQRGGTLFSNRR